MLDLNNDCALIEFLLKNSNEFEFEYADGGNSIKVFNGTENYDFENVSFYPIKGGTEIKTSITLNGQYVDLAGTIYIINSCLIVYIGLKTDPISLFSKEICLLSWR